MQNISETGSFFMDKMIIECSIYTRLPNTKDTSRDKVHTHTRTHTTTGLVSPREKNINDGNNSNLFIYLYMAYITNNVGEPRGGI